MTDRELLKKTHDCLIGIIEWMASCPDSLDNLIDEIETELRTDDPENSQET